MLRAARRMRLVGASGLTAALLSQRQLDERCRWYGECLRPAAGAMALNAFCKRVESVLTKSEPNGFEAKEVSG